MRISDWSSDVCSSDLRVFDRLRTEHGFTGGYTIIKDYIREREQRSREMFVPLAHPAGEAPAHCGEALVEIGGGGEKAYFSAPGLPHRDDTTRETCGGNECVWMESSGGSGNHKNK